MNFKKIAGTSFKEPINMKSLLTRTTYFHDSADDIGGSLSNEFA